MASNNHYLRSETEMDNYHADLEISVQTRSKSPESVHNSQHNKQRLQKKLCYQRQISLIRKQEKRLFVNEQLFCLFGQIRKDHKNTLSFVRDA